MGFSKILFLKSRVYKLEWRDFFVSSDSKLWFKQLSAFCFFEFIDITPKIFLLTIVNLLEFFLLDIKESLSNGSMVRTNNIIKKSLYMHLQPKPGDDGRIIIVKVSAYHGNHDHNLTIVEEIDSFCREY